MGLEPGPFEQGLVGSCEGFILSVGSLMEWDTH